MWAKQCKECSRKFYTGGVKVKIMTDTQIRPAQMIVKALVKDAQLYTGTMDDLPFHKGALVGQMNKCMNGDDNRHLVLDYVYHVSSSSQLTAGQWFALGRWVDAQKNDLTGKWEVSERFDIEALLIVAEARRAYIENLPASVQDAVKNFGATVSPLPRDQHTQDKPATPWQKSRYNKFILD